MATICLWFLRCLLPFSFVLACILEPATMLNPRDWSGLWATMWDDP